MSQAPTFSARGWRHLREALRFAPGRPAVALGVRAASAVVLPFLVRAWLLPGATVWMSVAGFLVTLSDKGGPYRIRARNMGLLTLLGAFSVTVAGPAGAWFFLSIPGVLLWGGLGALARIYGAELSSVGASCAVLFVISLAVPAAHAGSVWSSALERGFGVLLGGGWAMVLGLLLWPMRLYRPARRAVGATFQQLALHARHVAASLQTHAAPDWPSLQKEHPALRQRVEDARSTLAATRRGRRGESGRGERLLTLLQQADQMFVTLLAIEDLLEAGPGLAGPIAGVFEGFARTSEALGRDVLKEHALAALPSPDWSAAPLERALGDEALALEEPVRVELGHLALLVRRLRTMVEASSEVLGTLHDEKMRAPMEAGGMGYVPPVGNGQGFLETLRAQLNWDSVELRHAMRVGVTSAVAVAATHALHLGRGYWTTLTVIIVLQPHAPATLVKLLQRLGGTLLGVGVAVAITSVFHDRTSLMVTVTVLAGLSAAVLQLNYALYAFLLTPTFVLLAEINTQDWNLARLRIANTLLGGLLAFAGSWWLWPAREGMAFPARMAEPLRALRRYLDEVVRAVQLATPLPAPEVAGARRELGLAIVNAEASFQRRLAEFSFLPDEEEPLMTLLVYVRRLEAAGIALAFVRSRGAMAGQDAHLARFGESVSRCLGELEQALRTTHRPDGAPDFSRELEAEPDLLLRKRMERIALQLHVLRDAVERWQRSLSTDRGTP